MITNNTLKYTIVAVFLAICSFAFGFIIQYVKPATGDGEKTYRIRFVSVDKITRGTYVNFAGNPVGSVVKIHKLSYPPGKQQATTDGQIYTHEVTVKVDSGIKIHEQDKVYAATAGLLGERIITIIPVIAADESNNPEIPNNGLIFAQAEDAIADTFKQVSSLANKLGHNLDNIDNLVLENKDTIKKAILNLATLLSLINSSFEQSNIDSSLLSSIDTLISDLQKLAYNVNAVIKQTDDRDIVSQLSNSINNINSITESLAMHIVPVLQSQGPSILQDINDITHSISMMTQSVMDALNNSDEQKPTFISELISDPALYQESLSLVREIRNLIYDVNRYGVMFTQNKAWQHDRRQALSPPE